MMLDILATSWSNYSCHNNIIFPNIGYYQYSIDFQVAFFERLGYLIIGCIMGNDLTDKS